MSPPSPGTAPLSIYWDARSEIETQALARVLAPGLLAGDVVALQGPLGAGKTTFVRALVAALGGPADRVNSPTFTLIQHYPGARPVVHVDAYRLSGPAEFAALGGEELFEGEDICLVEWADRLAGLLPVDCWRIEIAPLSVHARRFTISAGGAAESRIEALRERLIALSGSAAGTGRDPRT